MLISLALVIAMGGLGVGYAMWSDMLTVKGNVSTGFVDIDFASQYDNDGGTLNDPSEAGTWTFNDVATWTGTRYEKNVGSTTSTFSDAPTGHLEDYTNELDVATIEVANGYPCYWGAVAWDLKNRGTIPMKLNGSPKLIRLSKSDVDIWSTTFDLGTALEIGTRYYVDADAVTQPAIDTTLDAGDDFSFVLSGHNLDQIDPETWTNAGAVLKGYIDIAVHVEQDATQKAKYDFSIAFQFCNWNE